MKTTPTARYTHNNITATIYENNEVELHRNKKTEEGKWKQTNKIRYKDIENTIKALNDAKRYIKNEE